jgi:hypothetical protein
VNLIRTVEGMDENMFKNKNCLSKALEVAGIKKKGEDVLDIVVSTAKCRGTRLPVAFPSKGCSGLYKETFSIDKVYWRLQASSKSGSRLEASQIQGDVSVIPGSS